MANICQITASNGVTYDIVDQGARDLIEALGTPAQWIGVTTTILTDGATTNPITINGESVTATTGNITGYTPTGEPTQEYIFDGTIWQLLGATDFSSLGALAYKDTASGTYTKPTGSATASYTSTAATVTITDMTASGGGNYRPEGTISLTSGNVTAAVGEAASGNPTYTPGGTVSTPTISLNSAGSTTTIQNPTSVTVAKTVATAAPGATAPANPVTMYSYDSTTGTLNLYQLGYTTGDSITTSDITVKTGDGSYTSSQPTFTGTDVRLVTENISIPQSALFGGTKVQIDVDYDKTTGITVGTTTDTVSVS